MRLLGAVLLLLGAAQLGTAWAGLAATAVLGGAVLAAYLAPGRFRLLALLIPVSYAYAAGARTIGDAVTALTSGVPRLLTAPRPAPPTVDLLLPFVVVAVLIGLWVGLRHPGRFSPLLASVALYVGGALLTAGQADPHGLVAAAIGICAVLGWSLPVSGRGRTFTAIAVAAATALGVAVIATTVGAFEPRRLVTPPSAELIERSPLSRLATLAEDGDRELLRHSGVPGRLRLVALSRFDGSAWAADARYRPIGAVGPPTLPPGNDPAPVSAAVTIGSLEGVWLPALGTPTAVAPPPDRADVRMDVRMDAESGSLIVAGGLRPGLRYTVSAQVDRPSDGALQVAAVPAEPRYLDVPRLPYLFAEYAQRVVNGARTPFEQAILIEAAVREQGRLTTTAPAGSSYARLETFLFGRPGTPGARTGTSEQFATAFAVLARATGLPTRVVFGFQPGRRGADGTYVVRARDALAWPEVYFTGLGWMPFDPTPQPDRDADEVGVRKEVLDRVGPDEPTPRPAASRPDSRRSGATPAPAADSAAPPLTPWRIARLLLTAALVGLAAVALARARRRLRHRRLGAPGAWSEVLDLLVLVGVRPPPWRTTQWVATAVPAGADAALRLAELADRSVFAPPGPVASPWRDLRAFRRALRRTVPWYRRLAWPIDPRPLLRR